MTAYVERFSLRQRVEHLVGMILFTTLATTGLPQKYADAGWATTLIGWMGGIELTRWFHRTAGILFSIMTAIHVGTAIASVLGGRASLSIVPTKQDFRDAITNLRYYLGLIDHQARFDRFDFRQKFEYWGLLMGASVVIGTGWVLLYPITVTTLLPGELVPAAQVAHSNEGLLAFLVVVVWHIYNAHLNPDVFPFDRTIFNGKISLERLRHEHPLEYERLKAAGEIEEGPVA